MGNILAWKLGELAEQVHALLLFSQLYHFFAYSIKKPEMQLEKGMLIISIDVDVGNRELGIINKGRNSANFGKGMNEYKIGEIEELALPSFAETFNNFGIPVTFAIRGQLTEVNGSILGLLLKSSVKHDIGSHGYYHRMARSLSRDEFENELNAISLGMEKFGIVPRTFVFPYNSVAYLDLLEKHGYKCYRGYGDFMTDRMCIEKDGQLYNIHPSLYINQHIRLMFLKKILDISIASKSPFHIWFHLWNFGETKKEIQKFTKRVFLPFLGYAKRGKENGVLSFETMLSAALKVEGNLSDA